MDDLALVSDSLLSDSVPYRGRRVKITTCQLENVARFYRPRTEGEPSLFQIWENGGARGDSVTPSTYSERYRAAMVEKLIKELECTSGSTMLSLGCGNAMVEAVLAGKGYQVACVDAMPEAVTLARAKGLDALCADILQWAPDQSWPLVYLDGVLGHVYDPATGLRPLLKRIRSWLEPADGARYATLVASNDVTKNGQDVQAAPGVPGFHWLSAGYIHDQALEAGFDEINVELFEYERPQSGNRMRVIVDARIKV